MRKRQGVECRRFLWAVVLGAAVAAPVAADDTKVIVDRQIRGVGQPGIYVADEFIAVLNENARGLVAVGTDRTGRPVVNLPTLQTVIDGHGVQRLEREFPGAQPQGPGSRFQDVTGYYKVKIGPGADLDKAMNAFARNPNVDHVEKIGVHPMYGCATGTPLTPNDTWYDNPPPTFPYPQWDLWDTEGIDADLAWSTEAGEPTVVVVGMDSGVRYFHADLGGPDPPGPSDNVTNGNIWVNPFEIPGNGIDDEGNGYVDDVVGWDFVTGVTGCSSGEDCSTPDNDPRDFNGHGTHTAGTMAAITNNASGVAGIAGGFGDGTSGSAGNGAKIMCMRIGWAAPLGGYVRMDFAAQAMNYVADMKNRGVNVAAVNASWGSSNSGGIDAAVNNLLAADVMLIHAAGNSGNSVADYLGNKAGVMNVAATDQNGLRASFSNYGSWVDIAAPGVEIISTYHNSSDPANDYVAVLDGTSMAAPHVAGVAALLESCNPSLSGPQKFSIMVRNGCAAGSANIGDILNARLALDAAGCGGGCTSDPECDDGLFCNGAETCNLGTGQCEAGTPPNCGDDVGCTDDSCNETTDSCEHVPNNANCDDGSACNGAETCNATLGCQAGTPVNCDDGVACTIDACNEPSGTCSNTPNDAACDDGVFCNGAETCNATLGCQAGTPPTCDDGVACTDDSCNSITDSCDNVANDANCDDGLFCNGTETCDPVLDCQAGSDPCLPGETCDEVADICVPSACNDNGTCESGEDCDNCPNDCPSGSGASCGNGVCEAGDGEDCVICPADCNGVQNGKPQNRFCCGDGDGQNPLPCSDPICTAGGFSCTDQPAVPSCCGDFVCEGTENSFNCELDCGAPPSCGDATCQATEDSCSCPEDCGAPPSTETSCTDGLDNDCDTFTDCNDSDCAADPACSCGAKGDPCSVDGDCCSFACKPNGTCR